MVTAEDRSHSNMAAELGGAGQDAAAAAANTNPMIAMRPSDLRDIAHMIAQMMQTQNGGQKKDEDTGTKEGHLDEKTYRRVKEFKGGEAEWRDWQFSMKMSTNGQCARMVEAMEIG